MHITKAVKDDNAITAIMLPLRLSFLLVGTSTPIGFIVLPSFSWPGYDPSNILSMLGGAEGGEGGRPEEMIDFQK